MTPEELAAWSQDSDMRESLQEWGYLTGEIRRGLDTALPDRRVFVLYALTAAGHSDDLTDEELEEVEANRESITQALENSPALQHVATCIAEDRAEFMACCEEEQTATIYRISPLRRVAAIPMIWRIAAVIVVAVGLAVIAQNLLRDDRNTIAVASGESEQVMLPDGSTVRMIGASELRYDSNSFEREVFFQGNAFFEVEPGGEEFVVFTDGALTTVHGTRFGLMATYGKTELILEHGSVSLASEQFPDQAVLLTPGERSSVVSGMLPEPPQQVNLNRALVWTGYLFFDATPMSEVATILEERFGVAVTVAENLEAEGVSGAFAPEDTPEYILSVLAPTLGATLEGDETAGFTVR